MDKRAQCGCVSVIEVGSGLYCVSLAGGRRFLEGRQLRTGRVDAGDLRVIREGNVEPTGVENLRHEIDVGERGTRPEGERPRLDQGFDGVEALADPMGVPGVPRGLVLSKLIFEIARARRNC